MIECVTLENNHLFSGNPIYEQHKLRYSSIIKRQSWDVPVIRGMEYDSYDNPSAYYLIRRDDSGKAIGVSRLYPTDRPYMLQQAFPHLVTRTDLPQESGVWEGSRFCIEASLPPAERKQIVHEIVVAYLEFALAYNISNIIGVMYPVYWKNIFIQSGGNVEWMGDIHRSEEGHKIIAGNLKVSQAVLDHVRNTTEIFNAVLNHGYVPSEKRAAA